MKVLYKVLGYNNLKIIQDNKMFSFTLDSILLSRFVKIKSHKNIIDIGTNNCIIPLIISNYTNAKIIGLEIQEEACKIAKENIIRNKKQDQINVIKIDFNEFYMDKINNNAFDMVICNPPYFKIENSSKKNISLSKKIARHEFTLTLENLIKGASKILNNKNDFYFIHIIERLDEAIFLLKKYDFAIKEMQMVYPKKNELANRFLVHAVYKGVSNIKVLKPLICHNDDGSFTKDLEMLFND